MRVISLCPSLTELVFDLDAGADLVGRTKFCIHPADRVEGVEKLGGTKNPKIDRIVELAPDLVLLNEEENRVEDADALKAAGVRCHVSFPRDAMETATMVRDIAAHLNRTDSGERIATDIEQRAARVRRNAEGKTPVRYAYMIWRDPWMVAADDTFVDAMLSLAGGENVFAGSSERYPQVTEAEIAERKPDVVLLSTEPFPFAEKYFEELAATVSGNKSRVRLVDGELLSWHGSRTPAGIDYAEQVMEAVRSRG